MADDVEKRYRFGDCELDLEARQLFRGGEPVALQPRVFDLLAFLISERHRAVDKNEIQDAVWSPAIVTDAAMTRAIMKARRAVSDKADQQAVIRTVHGHGYQFVAPLIETPPEPEPEPIAERDTAAAPEPIPAPAAPASETPQRKSLPLSWLLLAGAAVLVVAIVTLWRPAAETGDVRIAVLPVIDNTGDDDLAYVRFGLMGLANDLFVDVAGMDVVRTADVLSFVENQDWDGGLEAEGADAYVEKLRDSFGASHVIVPELEQTTGGLRLNYTLIDRDGREQRNTMVSARGTDLVEGMVLSVTNQLGDQRYQLADGVDAIDDDPFINEAYARATSVALEGRCAEAVPLFDVVLARNPDIARARIGRGNCLYRLGEWEDAEAAFTAIIESEAAAGNDSIRAEALGLLGTVYHRTGRLDLAEATYQSGLALAEAIDDPVATARLLTSQAILAKDRREFDEARSLLARATLVYRELEWETLPGQLYSTLANIAMNDGELDEAETHLDAALVSFRSVGDRRNEAMMLNNYGYLRRLQGRYSEALDLHHQSLAIRRDIGDRVGQGRILGMLSLLYEREGRYDEASEAAAEAVEIAREANDSLFIATGLAQLATAERGLGNLAAAEAALRESRDIFLSIEDQSRAYQVDLRLAQLDMDRGDLDAAMRQVLAVREQALAGDMPDPAIEAMQYAGDVAILMEDVDAASRYYEEALAHIEATGVTAEKTAITVRLANLYLDQGDTSAAEPLLGYIVEQEPTPAIDELLARYREAK